MKINFYAKYESTIIVNSQLKYIGDIKEKIFEIIDSIHIEEFEDCGNRKLAYDINGENLGRFIRIVYYAKDNIILGELEKYFRINSDILKFVTIKLKDGVEENGEYNELLYKILDIYTENEWEDEPLDESDVDRLAELLRVKLNLINGNITQEEYNKILG